MITREQYEERSYDKNIAAKLFTESFIDDTIMRVAYCHDNPDEDDELSLVCIPMILSVDSVGDVDTLIEVLLKYAESWKYIEVYSVIYLQSPVATDGFLIMLCPDGLNEEDRKTILGGYDKDKYKINDLVAYLTIEEDKDDNSK